MLQSRAKLLGKRNELLMTSQITSQWIQKIIFVLLMTFVQHSFALTLNEAYELASQRSETLLISKSRLSESEQKVKQTESRFLPEIKVSANYQQQDTVISSSGEKNSTTTKLTLSQSLFTGGADQQKRSSAIYLKEAQESEVKIDKNELYLSVAQVFYQMLASQKEIENTKKSIELMQKRQSELQKRVKVGKSRNVEILSASAQNSILQAQLQANLSQLSATEFNLKQLTGLNSIPPLTDSLNLSQEIEEMKKNQMRDTVHDPELSRLSSIVKSAESDTLAAKAAHMPTLDLSGNYYVSRSGNQRGPDWDVSLIVTLPLFSGGATQAQVQTSVEKKVQAELFYKQKKKSLDFEMQTLIQDLFSYQEQIKFLETALQNSEKSYQELEKDYRFSLATNLEVLQALNTYQDAKRNLDRTHFEALITYAKLQLKLGKIKL